METDVDQAYQGWLQDILHDGDEAHAISVSEMLQHGSVTFGRFHVEPFSWGRNSLFSRNRCQEELAKLNGIVAQRKAYFENYYGRNRALKAQKNQQTELALDYEGGNNINNIPGQSTEEYITLGGGTANSIYPSEKVEVGETFKQESNSNGLLKRRSLVQDPMSPDLTNKAQQNQQTDLTLDYGGDNVIYSQNGDEVVSLKVGTPDTIHPSEREKVGANFKQDSSGNNPLQIRCLGAEPIFPKLALQDQQNQQTELILDYVGDNDISSQSGDSEEHENLPVDTIYTSRKAKLETTIKQESNFKIPLQGRYLDPESTLQDLNSLRDIAGKCEQKENSVDSIQVQTFETVSLLAHTAEMEKSESNCIRNLGIKDILQKHENIVTNTNLPSVMKGAIRNSKSKSHPLQSTSRSLGCKSDILKDLTAVRNGLSYNQETKSNVLQSLKGSKDPRNMVHKTKTCPTTSMTMVNRIKNNPRPSLIDSNRPCTEVCVNNKIPGAFILVMERRASSRRTAATLDPRSSNKQSSSLCHANIGVIDLLNKTATITGVGSRKQQEIKRDSKQLKNKALELDNLSANLHKIEACVLQPPKSRYINLPSTNKSMSNGGARSLLAASKRNKQKEESSSSGNDKKPRLDNALSLDGRKTRNERPRWR